MKAGVSLLSRVCRTFAHVSQASRKKVYNDFFRAIHLWSSSSMIGRMFGSGVQT